MLDRMLGAAILNIHVYHNMESARRASLQAVGVLGLASLATAYGVVGPGLESISSLLFAFAMSLVWWAVWYLATYTVGTTLLSTPDTDRNWVQLARAMCFAQSPGLLRALGFLPGVGPLIFVGATLWQLAATVPAVNQAFHYRSTERALVTALVGFSAVVLIFFIIVPVFLANL